MDTTIMVLMILLVVLQAIGVYLLLVRKRFKLTNEKIDLEDFLRKLDEDVARGSRETDRYLKEFRLGLEKYQEDTKKLLSYVEKNINDVTNQLQADSADSKQEIGNTVEQLKTGLNKLLTEMREELNLMRNEVEAAKMLSIEKEEKIKRYEEGYDQKVIKNFRQELFKILHYIEQEKKKNHSDALIEVHEDLELLLEDVGIEKINIEIGNKYDGNTKVAAIKEVIMTDNIEQDGIIADVLRDGYFIQIANEKEKVLRPSELIIYKYNNKEDEVKLDSENKAEDNSVENTNNEQEGKLNE